MDVSAAQLWWLLSNMNMTQSIQQTLGKIKNIHSKKLMNSALVAPTPAPLSSAWSSLSFIMFQQLWQEMVLFKSIMRSRDERLANSCQQTLMTEGKFKLKEFSVKD